MTELDDHKLLAEFASGGSETAFAVLVGRYVNLVYSAALRSTGNSHHAEEITQAVFIILARKAAGLRGGTVLSGWLYQTARLTAANFVKGEIRRQNREQEAFMQSSLNESETIAWQQLAPLLDQAMGDLNETDRNAVVLRYFENKTAREVGTALKLSESAAHKRVTRALDKLRAIFAGRGITLSAVLIAGAVSANSIQAAPAGLATAITTAAAKGVAGTGSTWALAKGVMKLMAWAKVKTTVVVVVSIVLATATTSVVVSKISPGDRAQREILQRVSRVYSSMSSYSSSGTTVEEIDGKTITAVFTMRLARPNLYRVEYEQHAPNFTNKGAAWSDGTGSYFANDAIQKTTRMPPGPAHTLSDIADISGGTTVAVPSLFFGIDIPDASTRDNYSALIRAATKSNARLERQPDEKVGAFDCDVLSAATGNGSMRWWIGKNDSLIHRTQQIEQTKLPEATDAEVTKMLEGFPGKMPFPMSEMKRRINEGRKKANTTLKPTTIVFSTEKAVAGIKSVVIDPPGAVVFNQMHEAIATNESFSQDDFIHMVAPPAR